MTQEDDIEIVLEALHTIETLTMYPKAAEAFERIMEETLPEPPDGWGLKRIVQEESTLFFAQLSVYEPENYREKQITFVSANSYTPRSAVLEAIKSIRSCDS